MANLRAQYPQIDEDDLVYSNCEDCGTEIVLNGIDTDECEECGTIIPVFDPDEEEDQL